MDIKIEMLQHYFNANEEDVLILFNEDALIFCRSYDGGVRIHRSYQDLIEILILNNKISKTVNDSNTDSVRIELNKMKKDYDEKRIDNIDYEIYDTLTRYIIQLLYASRGKLLYPDLKFLTKDDVYTHRFE